MVNVPAQLASGTGAALQPAISTTSVFAGLATATGAAGIPGTSATDTTFPSQQLGIRVDLLLAGVWTDITRFVYQRNPVQITNVGRSDWTSTIQPANLTLTLNNRDGRFTPKLSTGAYFPNIMRNTQIRVFLSVTSATGVNYAGFRFYGEVSEWPPHWDPSGHEVSVDIVASGIWRRMSQLQTSLGSAFRRFIVNGAAATGLRSYWPMEDGSGSGFIVPYGSVAGTPNAIQSFLGGQTGLSFASSSDFRGSDGIPVLNAASVTATVPAGGTATNNVTRFVISVPAVGDSASGTTNWNLVEIDSAGTVAKFELYLNATGTLLMQGRNSAGGVVFAGTTTNSVKGQSYLVSMELTPSGGNVAFALRIIAEGASGITESVTGTLSTASVGAVSRVVVSRANQLMDTAFGHLSVAYLAPTSLVQAANALNGYVGEKALDRFTRICGEMGIAFATIGTSSSSAAMGPQLDDTLSNVLQSIEDTDCGLLYELRDQFGLGYRTNASMANQVSSFTLNYAAATIDAGLATSYDDALTRNNVTITNWTGYTQQAILTAGAMSVLNPPNGIGNGYAYTRSVNAAVDTQIPGIATFLLNVGAVDEIRFPVVTIKMIRASSAPFFSSIPNLDIGDYFQITNPPSFLTTTTIKQLMWGYSETLNAREWTFSFNTVPETPWETGVSPGTIQTSQIPGGSPVTSSAPGAGGLGNLITNGSITPAMLNEGISIRTLGGSLVTISVLAPSNPNTGDIWIASSTGLISQWNGSAWAPILFNATNTIQAGTIISALIAAGTIVAGNIAAGTITAAEIAAGIIVAGIVNATTIQANHYLCYSGQGEFFAYSSTVGWQFTSSGGTTFYFVVATSQSSLIQVGDIFTWSGGGGPYTVTGLSPPFAGFVNITFTPSSASPMSSGTVTSGSGSAGTGSLINSIAGTSGTDIYGNAYPAGLFAQQMTLNNQAGSPTAFSAASVFYSSVAGRPRYLNSAGNDSVLERSTVNVANFPVGNTGTRTLISGPLNYLADEGVQSSEYEIEIDGIVNTGAGTNTLSFDLAVDGTQFAGGASGVVVGAAWFKVSTTYSYTLRCRLAVTTSGAGGTAVVTGDGQITQDAINVGSTTNTFATLGYQGHGVAFDTTSNHTLQIYVQWGGTSAGQAVNTWRTRVGRRM